MDGSGPGAGASASGRDGRYGANVDAGPQSSVFTPSGGARRDAYPRTNVAATSGFSWAPSQWPMAASLRLAWLATRLLPYRVLLGAGVAWGDLSRRVQPGRWRKTAEHLRRCFPELDAQAIDRLLRANARNYGIGVAEKLIGWWWPVSRLDRLLSGVHGVDVVRHVQQQGRGVLLLVLHTTTMDLCAALLRRQLIVDFTYQPAAHPVLEQAQRRGRTRRDIRPGDGSTPQHDVDTAPIQAHAVRHVIKRLRAGRCVWYAPDRYYAGKTHVIAPLFGQPAATITAASRFASMTGAAVVSLRFWRDRDGRYQLEFSAPWRDFPSDDAVADATRINAWIEQAVRQHPAQYRWVHKRFRQP